MIIRGARVLKNGVFTEEEIIMQNGRFVERQAADFSDAEILDADGLIAIPGLVDIHFHGCAGYDLCDGSEEAIQAIADYELSAGVLAICPATMTYPEKMLEQVVSAAAKHKNGRGADLIGLHLEGPFINPGCVGAQNPEYVALPDAEAFLRLQSAAGGMIRICDIAPEEAGAIEFIRAVRDSVHTISIAHTATDYETALSAFENGASRLAHTYNAMPGIHHRNPGPIVAAWEAGADAELICDGIHLHPAIVRATFQLFSDDRVILVSDSMRACGLPDGQYTLGGQEVTVRGRKAVLAKDEKVIAGSASNLMDCLRTAVLSMHIPLESAVKAAAHNPARSIGIDMDYGDIALGKLGNVLLLDDDLQVVHIIQKGVLIR